MTKPKLILFQVPYQSESLFHSTWFAPIIDKYFSVEHYQQGQHYPANAVFVMGCNGYLDSERRKYFENRRVIVDALWESNTGKWAGCFHNSNHTHLIFYGNQKNAQDPRLQFVPNWFWYNESLWYSALGYQDYVPNKTYSKLAFMPMNMVKPHRDQILSQIPNIDDFIYSYKEKHLPGDINKADETWQRYFNPNWYNDTYFSLVVETTTTGTGFVTEKTFKPCAYRHPFMVYGQAKTLQYIKQQGFETYENIFDETYDHISDSTQRLAQIIKNINEFKKVPYDQVTLEKIEHNHNLFFNTELVTNKIITEIIEPLVEYAH